MRQWRSKWFWWFWSLSEFGYLILGKSVFGFYKFILALITQSIVSRSFHGHGIQFSAVKLTSFIDSRVHLSLYNNHIHELIGLMRKFISIFCCRKSLIFFRKWYRNFQSCFQNSPILEHFQRDFHFTYALIGSHFYFGILKHKSKHIFFSLKMSLHVLISCSASLNISSYCVMELDGHNLKKMQWFDVDVWKLTCQKMSFLLFESVQFDNSVGDSQCEQHECEANLNGFDSANRQ